jgi:hypothetical protein
MFKFIAGILWMFNVHPSIVTVDSSQAEVLRRKAGLKKTRRGSLHQAAITKGIMCHEKNGMDFVDYVSSCLMF